MNNQWMIYHCPQCDFQVWKPDYSSIYCCDCQLFIEPDDCITRNDLDPGEAIAYYRILDTIPAEDHILIGSDITNENGALDENWNTGVFTE